MKARKRSQSWSSSTPSRHFTVTGTSHACDHRRDAVGDQLRLAHQAGAEAPGLHAVGRAAAVEVDLVEAVLGADARRLRQQRRLAAAQLQRHRMLDRIHRQQPRAVAVDHRVGMHHLGVQPRMRRQQAVEHAAVRVGPVHHRGDGQAQLAAGGMAGAAVIGTNCKGERPADAPRHRRSGPIGRPGRARPGGPRSCTVVAWPAESGCERSARRRAHPVHEPH